MELHPLKLLIRQLDIPMFVILAKEAGIQEKTGCRIKFGMTRLVSLVAKVITVCPF